VKCEPSEGAPTSDGVDRGELRQELRDALATADNIVQKYDVLAFVSPEYANGWVCQESLVESVEVCDYLRDLSFASDFFVWFDMLRGASFVLEVPGARLAYCIKGDASWPRISEMVNQFDKFTSEPVGGN
jgi:hypothetical protein